MFPVTAGSFADQKLLELSYPPIVGSDGHIVPRSYGWVMGGDGRLLITAFVGVIAILGWTLAHMVSQAILSAVPVAF